MNSKIRRSVSIRLWRSSDCWKTRTLLLRVVREEALELHRVLRAGHVGGVRVRERLGQGALLAALGVVVDPVGGDPLERVADHVDQLRVGDHRGHALGDALVLGEGGVVGRGLAADPGVGVEVGLVPVEPARPVALLDEEVELLRLRHRDLGVEAEVVVQDARPALLRPDHDQVRQRAAGASGRSRPTPLDQAALRGWRPPSERPQGTEGTGIPPRADDHRARARALGADQLQAPPHEVLVGAPGELRLPRAAPPGRARPRPRARAARRAPRARR